MKDKIRYYDRHGQLRLTFNEFPYYSEISDFKNWTWTFDEQFGQVRNLRRSKKEYALKVGIVSDSQALRDKLTDVFTEDVLAGQPGTLEIRGWKLPCYIIESEYSYDMRVERQAIFKVRATISAWTRRTFHTLGISSTVQKGEDLWRNYLATGELAIPGRGYNFGYETGISVSENIELATVGAGFIATIYGAVSNPIFYINNKPIHINVGIKVGEQLRITSVSNKKTIEVIQPNGTTKSAFVFRDKENSPFITLDKMNEIAYGELHMDFETVETRSEPSWN
jgi:hypothetical protein|nr:MAG TPA: hypothetical protein [Caudoviricetes sp.]